MRYEVFFWAGEIYLYVLRSGLNKKAGLLLALLRSLPGSTHLKHPSGLLMAHAGVGGGEDGETLQLKG